MIRTFCDVTTFDVVNNHLYFIQYSMLVDIDLNNPSRLNRTHYFSSMRIYQTETPHRYGNTTCELTCDPLISSQDICYCVDQVKQTKEYICGKYDTTSTEIIYSFRPILCGFYVPKRKTSEK
ncbi:hypothetical protein RF11_04808 [Thelohanellus kitauei]|uniref:Uncharacterized protein n=1 Tax=Thelohanellus kitauei TaxID=669202 RepID=A0A0C2N5M6_THEKT|nr:hypothetical protein RF11_04808 [Thelohanellus kitauei]